MYRSGGDQRDTQPPLTMKMTPAPLALPVGLNTSKVRAMPSAEMLAYIGDNDATLDLDLMLCLERYDTEEQYRQEKKAQISEPVF